MPRSYTPRSTRIQPRIDLETLESRRLMASFNRLSSPAQVYIQNLGATVSQTSDSAEVELKRTGRMKRAVQCQRALKTSQGWALENQPF